MFLYFLKTIAILSICSGLLIACGQKGPLYIPKEIYNVSHEWN